MATPLASGTRISDPARSPALGSVADANCESSGHPLLLRDLPPHTLKAGEGWSRLEVMAARIQTDLFSHKQCAFLTPRELAQDRLERKERGAGRVDKLHPKPGGGLSLGR